MPRARTTNTAFRRFECIDPDHNHNKFYELSVEMLLFGPTVTRRWGRIGSRRPRTLSKGYETWEEAKREIRAILSPAYSCILVPIMNNPPFGELRINPVGFDCSPFRASLRANLEPLCVERLGGGRGGGIGLFKVKGERLKA